MICPKCGNIDLTIPTPFLTKRGEGKKIGNCSICNSEIWAMPTTKISEHSQLETVEKGEQREELLVNIYQNWIGADHNKKTNEMDIDRLLYKDGKRLCYVEIKERSNSLNAYKMTQFPYAKIDTAKKLIQNEQLPVYIVLKFTDAWTRLKIDPNKIYGKGSKPFAPRYRSYQNSRERQVPVKLDVEKDLEILSLNKLCLDNY